MMKTYFSCKHNLFECYKREIFQSLCTAKYKYLQAYITIGAVLFVVRGDGQPI